MSGCSGGGRHSRGRHGTAEVLLETERLTLRWLTTADLRDLCELHSDPMVMHYLTGGRPQSREEIESVVLPRFLAWHQSSERYGYWTAVERSSGGFIGWLHFHPVPGARDEIELGYRLRRSAWGRGLATEGSRALLHKGFNELAATKVVAETLAANVRSRRVMEKLGMTLEGGFLCLPDELPGWDEPSRRGVRYSITKAQWSEAQHHRDAAG